MGFLDKIAKAMNEAKRASTVSGKLSYQEQNTSPSKDRLGRVIVKVESGTDIILGINEQDIPESVGSYLLGNSEAYDFVEDRKVKLFISKDTVSPYPDSVKVETKNCDFIGWILKDDSLVAVKVIDSLSKQIHQVAPELVDLVFEVEGTLNGTYEEDEDESGNKILIPDLTIEIGIRDPAEIDVVPN